MKLPKGFHLYVRDKMNFIMCDAINDIPGFLQVFTTRKGGGSLYNFSSLNTGVHTDDDIKTVKNNIKRIEKALDVKYTSAANQVHGDHVVVLQPSGGKKWLKGRDIVGLKNIISTDADGIISSSPGIAAGVRLADCVGTVIADPGNKVIASVHSGWKGIAAGIPVKAIKKMKKYFGSNPADLIAAVSPAIGPCCYEVGAELYNQLHKQPVFSNIFKRRKGRIYMDLWAGVKNLLLEAGLKKKNIHVCNICTFDNPKYFYSHRRDKGRTGRHMAIGAVVQVVKPKAKRQKLSKAKKIKQV